MNIAENFGIQDLNEDRHDNLSISWDFETDAANVRERYPVLLYTPSVDDPIDHHHIRLSDKTVLRLYTWLGEFLNMKIATCGKPLPKANPAKKI